MIFFLNIVKPITFNIELTLDKFYQVIRTYIYIFIGINFA